MIPKIIHYCWFGGKEKPRTVQNCIASWKRILPDYQIVEWNEQNFDYRSIPYTRDAYEAGKYAFVSDVARIQALQQYGGIYLDTDVELYKSLDSILDNRCVFGFEYENWVATSFMACEISHPIMQKFASYYDQESFKNSDGTYNMGTNVKRLTALLMEDGLVRDNRYQKLSDGIVVYPIEYFSPYDYANCIMEKTDNSYCAHLFLVTWLPKTEKIKKKMKYIVSSILGKDVLIKMRKLLK